MKLIEINKKEFLEFAENNISNNLFQTKEWAEYKRFEGWHTYFLGLDQNGQLKAVCLLLSKDIPIIRKRVFYSPRGYLINYKDLELLRVFTKYIKEFVKERKGMFIKINPYLSLKDLDKNGRYIIDGYDNEKCVDVIRSLGYIQMDSNFTESNLIYGIDLRKKSFDDLKNEMSEEILSTVKANKKRNMIVEDINLDDEEELSKVINLINETSRKTNFIGNNLDKFCEIFKEAKYLNVKIVKMDLDKYLEEAILNFDDVAQKDAEQLKSKYGGKFVIGAAISICYGKEVTTLCIAIKDSYVDLLATYNLRYELIKWAKENDYETYSFYGIGEKISDENKTYQYYKKFGGKVVKLLGEYDLVINPTLYKLYYKYMKKHNLKIEDIK